MTVTCRASELFMCVCTLCCSAGRTAVHMGWKSRHSSPCPYWSHLTILTQQIQHLLTFWPQKSFTLLMPLLKSMESQRHLFISSVFQGLCLAQFKTLRLESFLCFYLVSIPPLRLTSLARVSFEVCQLKFF